MFDHISLRSNYNEKLYGRKIVGDIKTHILYPVTFFFPKIGPFMR